MLSIKISRKIIVVYDGKLAAICRGVLSFVSVFVSFYKLFWLEQRDRRYHVWINSSRKIGKSQMLAPFLVLDVP